MIILMRYKIQGKSMEPTFKEDQIVLASSIPYLFSKPKVGDIVIAKDPRTGRLLLKRIISKTTGTYFIEGDNKERSTDSRNFGFLSRSSIIAKIIYTL